MKTLIIYKSKYGASKQYAEWLHEGLQGSELESLDWFETANIRKYDLIIVVSRTYLGDIQARKFLEENWAELKLKKVFLLAIGLVFNGEAKKTFERIPEEIRSSINYLKVPGRIDEKKLTVADRFIAKVMSKNIPQDKPLSKADLMPVFAYVNNLERS